MKQILNSNEIHAENLYLEKVFFKKIVKEFLRVCNLINIGNKLLNNCENALNFADRL